MGRGLPAGLSRKVSRQYFIVDTEVVADLQAICQQAKITPSRLFLHKLTSRTRETGEERILLSTTAHSRALTD